MAQKSIAPFLAAVVTNSAGSATSNPATLTVHAAGQAPVITGQPGNQDVNAGQPASFTVTATGTAPLSYQWQKFTAGKWAAIAGATSATYTIASTPAAMWVSTAPWSPTRRATSNPATLTVHAAGQVPVITGQPGNQDVTAGQSPSFTVTATGAAPLSYQWQKFTAGKWAAIAGATSATYTIASTAAADAGQYRAVVTNSAGSATSNRRP